MRRALAAVASALVLAVVGAGAPAATASPRTAPRTPAQPTAVPGDGFVEVSWPVVAPVTAIDGYLVTRYDDGGAAPAAVYRTAAAPTRRRVGGLRAGHTYRFTVTTIDGGVTGSASTASLPVGPVATWPFITTDDLVAQVQQDFAGRPATTAEQVGARAALGGGRSVGRYLVDVAHETDGDRPAAVARLYLAYFRRPPDPSGFRYWVGRLRAGVYLEVASSRFAGSSEFLRTYGALSNGGFVDLVYRNVLGRSPDPGGRAYWVRQLDGRRRTRGAVMTQFSESSENVRKRAEEVDAILLRYELFGTTPSRVLYDQTVARIEGGTPSSTVAQEWFDSEAYRARFGRESGAPIQAPGAFSTFSFSRRITQLAVTPGGRYGAALVPDLGVVVIDLLAQRSIVSFPMDPYMPQVMAMSVDGSQLMVSTPDGRALEVVDTATFEVVRTISPPAGSIATGAWAAVGGRWVLRLTTNGRIDVVAFDPDTEATALIASDLRDEGLALTRDGTRVAYTTNGRLRVADATTGAPLGSGLFAGTSASSLQAWGDRGFVDGSVLYDRDGHLVRWLAFGRGTRAVDPAGERTYGLAGNRLEVVDLDRGLALPSTPMPRSGWSVSAGAVSGDGRTIALALEQSLMMVMGAPSAPPALPTPAPRAPFSPFVPTASLDGSQVSDVEVAPDGATVWAANPGLNQVEVFDADTRDRLATIPLGFQVGSIDFTPDGSRAYVVGPGSPDAVVIDAATRTVDHRFALPESGSWERPVDAVVTADGRLVVLRRDTYGHGVVVLVDLATEQEVTGFARLDASAANRLAVSDDRTRVLIPVDDKASQARWYETATGVASAPVSGANYSFVAAAVDQHGQRVFAGRRVLDGSLVPTGAIDTPLPLGYAAGISPDGHTGYRVEGTSLRVMDLDVATTLRSVVTGAPTSQISTSATFLSVSADGATVAAVVDRGVSILHQP